MPHLTIKIMSPKHYQPPNRLPFNFIIVPPTVLPLQCQPQCSYNSVSNSAGHSGGCKETEQEKCCWRNVTKEQGISLCDNQPWLTLIEINNSCAVGLTSQRKALVSGGYRW